MTKQFILILSIVAFSFYNVSAQTNCVPDMLHLTAVARDASGNPIIAPVNVKVVFALGSSTGTAIYCETSTTSPNSFGEFSFNVGDPANTLCTPNTALNSLPWSSCNIFYNIYYSTTLTFPTSPNASGQFTTSPFSFASRSAEKLTTSATTIGQVLTWNGTDWVAQTLPSVSGGSVQNRIGFSSSGSWTCPSGITSIIVECWGAGGGSGTRDTCSSGGCYPNFGFGGKGGYNKQTISVTPGNNYTITIGAGGTAGIFRSSNGQSGGSTSFNGLVVAQGGSGGANGHCSGCSPTSGTNGTDGTVTNYNWTISAIPSIRSYIPQPYLTNVYYPSTLAKGGTTNGWWGTYIGSNGEDGFMVITY